MSDLTPKGFSYGQYLNNFPAADVAPVRYGRWEWDRRIEAYRCSSCKRHNADRTAYCPNCGADLREDTT